MSRSVLLLRLAVFSLALSHCVLREAVLNTVARTSLLDGPLKQLNKGGSRIAPFTVKRDANNHSRDNNDEVQCNDRFDGVVIQV
ncbi:hypothetical protein YC2023_053727 [Brassica napus]